MTYVLEEMRKEKIEVRLLPKILRSESSPAQGSVEAQYWDRSDRLKRAAIAWLGCWGAAILCVFIPLLHFILVPSLLLAGPIVSSLIFNQKDVITGGKALCPNCGKEVHIERTKLSWPISDLCDHCGEELTISQAEK